MIQDYIKANISTALVNVRSERNDPIVSTEPPNEYFIYEEAHAYRAPAVYILAQDEKVLNSEKGSNYFAARDSIIVNVIVEDRIKTRVTKKAWRYQAALLAVLHETILTSSDNALRLFSIVEDCQFSPVTLKDPKSADAVFRKEVSLALQVEHIENLQAD
jgi:hypothetical protein